MAQVAADLPGAIGIACDLVAPGGVDKLVAATREVVGDPDGLVLNGPGPAPGLALSHRRQWCQRRRRNPGPPPDRPDPGVCLRWWSGAGGRILSIGSTSVEAPIANLALSNLGRAALAGYLKTLATEVAAQGITVKLRLLGKVATPRARQIDEASAARSGVRWLRSKPSSPPRSQWAATATPPNSVQSQPSWCSVPGRRRCTRTAVRSWTAAWCRDAVIAPNRATQPRSILNDRKESDDSRREVTPAETRRAGIAGLVGTTIEWYDFYIYGLAAALVFPKEFFPTASPAVGTLASLGTFAVGFVARPLGGIIFGHIGDRVGRKTTLMFTLFLMGAATVVVGLLPGYAVIGIWARSCSSRCASCRASPSAASGAAR